MFISRVREEKKVFINQRSKIKKAKAIFPNLFFLCRCLAVQQMTPPSSPSIIPLRGTMYVTPPPPAHTSSQATPKSRTPVESHCVTGTLVSYSPPSQATSPPSPAKMRTPVEQYEQKTPDVNWWTSLQGGDVAGGMSAVRSPTNSPSHTRPCPATPAALAKMRSTELKGSRVSTPPSGNGPTVEAGVESCRSNGAPARPDCSRSPLCGKLSNQVLMLDGHRFLRSMVERTVHVERVARADKPVGEIAGIGISFRQCADGSFLVVDVVQNSGAEVSGITPGDVIVEAQGQIASTLSTAQLVQMIKGPPGTFVDMVLQGTLGEDGEMLESNTLAKYARSRSQTPPQDEPPGELHSPTLFASAAGQIGANTGTKSKEPLSSRPPAAAKLVPHTGAANIAVQPDTGRPSAPNLPVKNNDQLTLYSLRATNDLVQGVGMPAASVL